MVSPLPLVNLPSGVQSCDFPNDNNNNPKQFCEDLESEYACSESEPEPNESAPKARNTQNSPPLSYHPPGPFRGQIQPMVLFDLNEGASRLGAQGGVSTPDRSTFWRDGGEATTEIDRFLIFLQTNRVSDDVIAAVVNYKTNHSVSTIPSVSPTLAANIILSGSGLDTQAEFVLREAITHFLRENLSQGGSSRRRLHRRRRTQYTKKHKRSSSKTTKRATIKRIKSYRKHTRTIKRRKSRRHQ
jgi:hypothetical protein